MHQIQKLEIIGFKSFSERTQLTFNEGVTAIVGPNGCGKSNISDAINWVVGEQSAKSLRTDRMEGVIFNGTQSRRATGFAEVVLTLSLDSQLVNPGLLDLSPEGFSVGRRLYRTGESEYYLDGKRCRLKDIQVLFEGTGLGPNSYAIIEQGRIEQMLSSRPSERRGLFEEAARITLFKSRKYSAEMKLEAATQNLLRIQDIVREVARQLNSLRRQAAKARRYNRLREELRGLHKLKIGLEQRDLSKRLAQSAEQFESARRLEMDILSSLESQEKSRAVSADESRSQETLVNELREHLAKTRVDAGNARSRRENQQSQEQALQSRLQELGRELLAIRERGELVRRERERLDGSHRLLLEELTREQEELEREKSRREVIDDAIGNTEKNIDDLRLFLLNKAGRLADLRNQKARYGENIERIDAQRERLESERESRTQERKALLVQLDDFRGRSEAANTRLAEISGLRAELENRAAQAAQRVDQTTGEMVSQQEEYSIMQHRFSSLEEVERRRSNYSEGVQKFLSTQLPGEESATNQTLADHIETDAPYEAAVEDYMNDPLQYILVGGMSDAVQSVERVKRIGAGKCTFLTLRNGHVKEVPTERPAISDEGVVGYLDQILRMRGDVKGAFERVLPEYASTVMVSDLDTAFRVAESNPGLSFLTLGGESYSPRGMLSAVGERKSMAGFLALKREKRELSEKLSALRQKIELTRASLSKLKEDQRSITESLNALFEENRKLDIEAVVLKHHLARLEGEIQKVGQTEQVVEVELARLRTERSDYGTKVQEVCHDIEVIEERSRSGDEEMQNLTSRLGSLKTETSLLSNTLSEMSSSQAVRRERLSGMETEIRRLQSESEEVAGRLDSNETEQTGISAELEELERCNREVEVQIVAYDRDLQETEKRLDDNQQQLEEQRRAIEDLEQSIRQHRAEREEAMAARSKIEIEKTRLETDLEHLAKSSLEEFHLSLEEVLGQIGEDDWMRDSEEVSISYDELRDKLERFGAINMRALEEYEELDERYQFLNGQQEDIEKSIADTQTAIAEIKRRSIEQFRHAFDAIRKNFIEVFTTLFKGGQCDIRLLDESDILESGIDIIAQPPGKRLQNVLLLSGGEKALTALALLIAIFQYRRSPFCVLDEVDAALDDANIGLFNELVAELATETQFILITHNKKTMEIARTLYGVTMQEAGISRIVSVDLRPQQEALAS